MGNIYKISCECGYIKEYKLGGGLASRNMNIIKQVFSENELNAFMKLYERGSVSHYGLERELAVCPSCKELYDVEVLKYELIDKSQKEIIQKCPCCDDELKKNSDLKCPKCDGNLNMQEIGSWD